MNVGHITGPNHGFNAASITVLLHQYSSLSPFIHLKIETSSGFRSRDVQMSLREPPIALIRSMLAHDDNVLCWGLKSHEARASLSKILEGRSPYSRVLAVYPTVLDQNRSQYNVMAAIAHDLRDMESANVQIPPNVKVAWLCHVDANRKVYMTHKIEGGRWKETCMNDMLTPKGFRVLYVSLSVIKYSTIATVCFQLAAPLSLLRPGTNIIMAWAPKTTNDAAIKLFTPKNGSVDHQQWYYLPDHVKTQIDDDLTTLANTYNLQIKQPFTPNHLLGPDSINIAHTVPEILTVPANIQLMKDIANRLQRRASMRDERLRLQISNLPMYVTSLRIVLQLIERPAAQTIPDFIASKYSTFFFPIDTWINQLAHAVELVAGELTYRYTGENVLLPFHSGVDEYLGFVVMQKKNVEQADTESPDGPEYVAGRDVGTAAVEAGE